jgi:hypothetical protein
MSEKDDFVEDLFRDLPKSKKMSEIELKRHEKLILAKIEEMKLAQSKKQKSLYVRFQSQFQLAAGFMVLVGGLAFVLNQSTTTSNSDLNVAISKPSPTNQVEQPKAEASKPTNSEIDKPIDLNDEQTEFEIDQFQEKNYLYNFGLDYLTKIDQIRAKIKISPNPISISVIPSSYGKCAIELGVNTSLVAVDKGFYDGQSVLAFYSASSRSQIRIFIVTKSCENIAEL